MQDKDNVVIPLRPINLYRILVTKDSIYRITNDYRPTTEEFVVPITNRFFHEEDGSLVPRMWSLPRRRT
jgi:hypothetical protein